MNYKEEEKRVEAAERGPLPPLTSPVEVVGPYGPHVKVVCKPAAPPSCDLVVMVRDVTAKDGWREEARFNDMSNDYAHTDAHNYALSARRKIIEGEYT